MSCNCVSVGLKRYTDYLIKYDTNLNGSLEGTVYFYYNSHLGTRLMIVGTVDWHCWIHEEVPPPTIKWWYGGEAQARTYRAEIEAASDQEARNQINNRWSKIQGNLNRI